MNFVREISLYLKIPNYNKYLSTNLANIVVKRRQTNNPNHMQHKPGANNRVRATRLSRTAIRRGKQRASQVRSKATNGHEIQPRLGSLALQTRHHLQTRRRQREKHRQRSP